MSSSKVPPTTTVQTTTNMMNVNINAAQHTTTNAQNSTNRISSTNHQNESAGVKVIVGGLNNKYQLVRTIGRGAYGQVYKGIDASSKKVVAIKEIYLAGVLEKDLTLVTGEVDLLSSLRHENVVRYIEAIRDDHHLYIVLEYCENGSLASALKSFSSSNSISGGIGGVGPFPESLAAVYVFHVLKGLRYLHEQGVIHRDVKGANILCTRDAVVKLADFGVATKVNTATVTGKVGDVYQNSNDENNKSNNTSHSNVDARLPNVELLRTKREEEETAKLVKSRR